MNLDSDTLSLWMN